MAGSAGSAHARAISTAQIPFLRNIYIYICMAHAIVLCSTVSFVQYCRTYPHRRWAVLAPQPHKQVQRAEIERTKIKLKGSVMGMSMCTP